MSISVKTRKILWGRSGNRCAICKIELVLEKDDFNRILNIGEECHIISEKTTGPRHEIIQEFDYDDYDNLLLLCCNHHTEIDEKIEKYPKEKLTAIKIEHENWVKENLDQTTVPIEEKENSLFSDIVNYVAAKHDIEMNVQESSRIFSSPKGLQLAFEEAAKIKYIINGAIEDIKSKSPQYNIILQDNKHHITDIMFKGNTLLSQFYQAYSNVADNSYLLFGIVKGYFNEQGYADPLNPVTIHEIIRLDFSYNDEGVFGWRNQTNNEEFYISEQITKMWIEKFFKYTLNE